MDPFYRQIAFNMDNNKELQTELTNKGWLNNAKLLSLALMWFRPV